MHTTNYFNTFIEVAEDCPAKEGEKPPMRGTKKSVANLQYEMLHDKPYQYTSDEVVFAIHATRKEIGEEGLEEAHQQFFSKGQPCFRASPLTKRYGWGVHSNEKGKVAIFGMETAEYQQLAEDEAIPKKKAMRNKRKK